MNRLANRIERLERAFTLVDRSAERKRHAEAFRRDLLDLAERLTREGATKHDPRLSERENMAAAIARGDFETASAIFSAAAARRAAARRQP